MGRADLLIPSLIVLASVVGYLPALIAYRTDVLQSLTASAVTWDSCFSSCPRQVINLSYGDRLQTGPAVV